MAPLEHGVAERERYHPQLFALTSVAPRAVASIRTPRHAHTLLEPEGPLSRLWCSALGLADDILYVGSGNIKQAVRLFVRGVWRPCLVRRREPLLRVEVTGSCLRSGYHLFCARDSQDDRAPG